MWHRLFLHVDPARWNDVMLVEHIATPLFRCSLMAAAGAAIAFIPGYATCTKKKKPAHEEAGFS
jgi:hypothetical protein